MPLVQGYKCEAYYGPSGSTATTLIGNLRDVTQNLKKGKVDVSTRGGNGWRQFLATLKEGETTIEILHNRDDPFRNFILSAWELDTIIALAFFDDAGVGIDADFMVFDVTRSEPIEDAVRYNITVDLAPSDRVPVLT